MSDEQNNEAGLTVAPGRIGRGVIGRLSAAYRRLRDEDERSGVNPLQVYEPLVSEPVKSLTQMPHPRAGYGGYTGGYYYGGERFAGSNIDFAAAVGDLSKSSLIMSAVRVVGNTLPEAPLQVKDPGDGKGDEQVIDNGLVELFRKPNACYAGDALWTAFAYSWLVDGNAYFIKVWSDAGTKVVELWYEPHWNVKPRWMDDQKGGYMYQEGDDPKAFINYYELDREGKKYRFELSDVLHFRDGIDPYNTRCGWSYIKSVYREIYGDNELSNLGAQLGGGSFVPPFFIGIEPEIDFEQEDADRLEDQLARKTSGDKRGRPMVVYGGKPYKLTWSPSDIDLKMLHRFSEERFCAVTGIPAEVLQLGVGKDHNIYENYTAGQRAYYEGYLKPLYRRIGSQVNLSLLPDFTNNSRLYTAHDLSKISALQEGADAKAERYGKAYERGGIMRSEYRASGLGLGPSDPAKPDADKVFYKEAQAPQEAEGDDKVIGAEVVSTNGNGAKR